jgi:hypothetical protein
MPTHATDSQEGHYVADRHASTMVPDGDQSPTVRACLMKSGTNPETRTGHPNLPEHR